MDMKRYQHGGNIYRTPGIRYDFSANINPLGMPAAVQEALQNQTKQWEHYPDPDCIQLRRQLSLWEGVPGDWFLCGNGAADLIFRMILADQPRKALLLAPTFSEYEKALLSIGCEITYWDLSEANDFQVTKDFVDAIEETIDLVVLCNPNNPTGQLIRPEIMEQVADRCCRAGTRVLVDECFLDFVIRGGRYSAKRRLAHCPNLVILKAFTKIFAMPGLRLGYVMTCDEELLQRMEEVAQAWSVSGPAQTAGLAALGEQEYLDETQELIERERERLLVQLQSLGHKAYPSNANFILFKSRWPLSDGLRKRGFLIRSCQNYRGLSKDYYRIAVRGQAENDALLQALREVKEENNG